MAPLVYLIMSFTVHLLASGTKLQTEIVIVTGLIPGILDAD